MSQDQAGPGQGAGGPEFPWPGLASAGYVQPSITPGPDFIYKFVKQTMDIHCGLL